MKRLILVLAQILLVACSGSRANSFPSKCEEAIKRATDDVLGGLDPDAAQTLRGSITGSRAYWTDDPAYDAVRRRVMSLESIRGLIRLEIGRAPGKGYHSVWFVDTGDRVLEFATGPESDGLREGVVDSQKWHEFTQYLKTLADKGVPSKVRPYMVDSPVHFYCAEVAQVSISFIVYAIPEESPQFDIIAKTLSLSQFKEIPRELKAITTVSP